MLALRAVCFWPGLPSAWVSGLARGLLVAVAFSWCMCLLLLATFVWPDWIGGGLLVGFYYAYLNDEARYLRQHPEAAGQGGQS